MKVLYFKQVKKDFCVEGDKLQLSGPLYIDPFQVNRNDDTVVSNQGVEDSIRDVNKGLEPKGPLTLDKMPLFEEDLFNKKGSNRFNIIKIHDKGGEGFIQEVDTKGRVVKVSDKLELKPGEYSPLKWTDFDHTTHEPRDPNGLKEGTFRLSDFMSSRGVNNYISKIDINVLPGSFYLETGVYAGVVSSRLGILKLRRLINSPMEEGSRYPGDSYTDLRPGDRRDTLNTGVKYVSTGGQPWKLQYDFNKTDGLILGQSSKMISPKRYIGPGDGSERFHFGDYPTTFINNDRLSVIVFPGTSIGGGSTSDYSFPLIQNTGDYVPGTVTENQYSAGTQFRSRTGTFYDTSPRGRKKLFQMGSNLIYITENYRGSREAPAHVINMMTLNIEDGKSNTNWVKVYSPTNRDETMLNTEVTLLEDKFVTMGRSTHTVNGNIAIIPKYVASNGGYSLTQLTNRFTTTSHYAIRASSTLVKPMRNSIIGNGDSFPHKGLIYMVDPKGDVSVLRSSYRVSNINTTGDTTRMHYAGYGTEEIGINVLELAFGKDYIINGFSTDKKQGLDISPATIQIATTGTKVHIFACVYVQPDEPVIGKPSIKQSGRALITTTLTFNKTAKTVDDVFIDDVKTYLDWIDVGRVPDFELDRRDGLLTCVNFTLAISKDRAFFVFPNEILTVPYTGGMNDYKEVSRKINADITLNDGFVNTVLEPHNRWRLGSNFDKKTRAHLFNSANSEKAVYRTMKNIAPIYYGGVLYIYRDDYKATLSDGKHAYSQVLATNSKGSNNQVTFDEVWYNLHADDRSGTYSVYKPAVKPPHWFDNYNESNVKFYQEMFIYGKYLYTFRLTIGKDETNLPVGTISLWRTEVNPVGTPLETSTWDLVTVLMSPSKNNLPDLTNTEQCHFRTFTANGIDKHFVNTINGSNVVIKFDKFSDEVTVKESADINLPGAFGDFISFGESYIYVSTVTFTTNPTPIDKGLYVPLTGKYNTVTKLHQGVYGGLGADGRRVIEWSDVEFTGEDLNAGRVKVSSGNVKSDILVQRFKTGELTMSNNLQTSSLSVEFKTGGNLYTLNGGNNGGPSAITIDGSGEGEVHFVNGYFNDLSSETYIVTTDKVHALTNQTTPEKYLRDRPDNGGIHYETHDVSRDPSMAFPGGVLETDRLTVDRLTWGVEVGGRFTFVNDDSDVFQKIGTSEKDPTYLELWSSMISTESLTFTDNGVTYVPDRSKENRSGLVKSNLHWKAEGSGKKYFGDVWGKIPKPIGFRDEFTIVGIEAKPDTTKVSYLLENKFDPDARFPLKSPVLRNNARYHHWRHTRPWMRNAHLDFNDFKDSAFTYESLVEPSSMRGTLSVTEDMSVNASGGFLFSEAEDTRVGRIGRRPVVGMRSVSPTLGKQDLIVTLDKNIKVKDPGVITSNNDKIGDLDNFGLLRTRVFAVGPLNLASETVIAVDTTNAGIASIHFSKRPLKGIPFTDEKSFTLDPVTLKTSDNTKHLTPVVIGDRLYLFEEGTARSYYSKMTFANERVTMGPVIESTLTLPGYIQEYHVNQNIVLHDDALYFFPGYHKDYSVIYRDVEQRALSPTGPNETAKFPKFIYQIQRVNNQYESVGTFRSVTVTLAPVGAIDNTPKQLLGYGRMEPIFLDSHMLLFIGNVGWEGDELNGSYHYNLTSNYMALALGISGDKVKSYPTEYSEHVDSIDMRVLNGRMPGVKNLLFGTKPFQLTMLGKRLCVGRLHVDSDGNTIEQLHFNTKWDYRKDKEWYTPPKPYNDKTVKITLSEPFISNSVSKYVKWSPTETIASVRIEESGAPIPYTGGDVGLVLPHNVQLGENTSIKSVPLGENPKGTYNFLLSSKENIQTTVHPLIDGDKMKVGTLFNARNSTLFESISGDDLIVERVPFSDLQTGGTQLVIEQTRMISKDARARFTIRNLRHRIDKTIPFELLPDVEYSIFAYNNSVSSVLPLLGHVTDDTPFNYEITVSGTGEQQYLTVVLSLKGLSGKDVFVNNAEELNLDLNIRKYPYRINGSGLKDMSVKVLSTAGRDDSLLGGLGRLSIMRDSSNYRSMYGGGEMIAVTMRSYRYLLTEGGKLLSGFIGNRLNVPSKYELVDFDDRTGFGVIRGDNNFPVAAGGTLVNNNANTVNLGFGEAWGLTTVNKEIVVDTSVSLRPGDKYYGALDGKLGVFDNERHLKADRDTPVIIIPKDKMAMANDIIKFLIWPGLKTHIVGNDQVAGDAMDTHNAQMGWESRDPNAPPRPPRPPYNPAPGYSSLCYVDDYIIDLNGHPSPAATGTVTALTPRARLSQPVYPVEDTSDSNLAAIGFKGMVVTNNYGPLLRVSNLTTKKPMDFPIKNHFSIPSRQPVRVEPYGDTDGRTFASAWGLTGDLRYDDSELTMTSVGNVGLSKLTVIAKGYDGVGGEHGYLRLRGIHLEPELTPTLELVNKALEKDYVITNVGRPTGYTRPTESRYTSFTVENIKDPKASLVGLELRFSMGGVKSKKTFKIK